MIAIEILSNLVPCFDFKFDCFEENVALDRFAYADYVLAGSKHFKERFDWENFSKNKMCLNLNFFH